MRKRVLRRTWKAFGRRDGEDIRAQLSASRHPCCPRCRGVLEARPDTRLKAVLPAGIRGYDLDCRRCRHFLPRVHHTPGSLYLLRIRRLASAILQA